MSFRAESLAASGPATATRDSCPPTLYHQYHLADDFVSLTVPVVIVLVVAEAAVTMGLAVMAIVVVVLGQVLSHEGICLSPSTLEACLPGR